MKKVTIYIDETSARVTNYPSWDKMFIAEIIEQELDSLSPYGEVKGYIIEDMKTNNKSEIVDTAT